MNKRPSAPRRGVPRAARRAVINVIAGPVRGAVSCTSLTAGGNARVIDADFRATARRSVGDEAIVESESSDDQYKYQRIHQVECTVRRDRLLFLPCTAAMNPSGRRTACSQGMTTGRSSAMDQPVRQQESPRAAASNADHRPPGAGSRQREALGSGLPAGAVAVARFRRRRGASPWSVSRPTTPTL